MSPPSGTRNEYSRKGRGPKRDSEGNPSPDSGLTGATDDGGDATPDGDRSAPRRRASPGRTFKTDVVDRLGRPLTYSRGLRIATLTCTLLGAAILLAAEFSTLSTVRAEGHAGIIQSTTAGADNSYALIPLAVLAVVLGVVAFADGAGRWVVGALMLAGVIALLIGLLHDLPAAHRTGFVGSFHTHLTSAASSPGAGMYMETLGAVLLIVAGGLGLLFGEPVAGVGQAGAVAGAEPAAAVAEPAGAAVTPKKASAPQAKRAATSGRKPASASGTKRSQGSGAKGGASGTKKRGSAAGSKRGSASGAKRAGAGAPKPAGAKAAGTKSRSTRSPAPGGPKQGSPGRPKRGPATAGNGGSPAGSKRDSASGGSPPRPGPRRVSES